MTYLTKMLVILLFISTLSCKKTPDFIASNDLDPNSENFEVPKIKSFRSYLNRDRSIVLEWTVEDGYYDGVLIQKFNPETKTFEDLKKIPEFSTGTEDDIVSKQTLRPKYRAFTYVNTGDKIKFSNDTVSDEVNTRFYDFKEKVIGKRLIQLVWNHNFNIDTAQVIIERSTSSNPAFSRIATLGLSQKSFKDDISEIRDNSLTYRVFAKTAFESSDTLTSQGIALNPTKPNNLEIDSYSDKKITLRTHFQHVYDGFELTLLDQNNRIISSVTDAVVKSDSIYFNLDGLSFSDSTYVISLISILNGEKSEPYINNLFAAPTLQLVSTYKTKSGIRYPQFNSEKNELIYYTDGEIFDNSKYNGHIKYSFETNNISPLGNLGHPFFYQDKYVYSIKASELIRWDTNGDQLESYPLPNEGSFQLVVNPSDRIALLKTIGGDLLVYDLEEKAVVNQFKTGNRRLSISQNGKYASVNSGDYFDLFEVNFSDVAFINRIHFEHSNYISKLILKNSTVSAWDTYQDKLSEYTLPNTKPLSATTTYNVNDIEDVEIIPNHDYFIGFGDGNSRKLYFIEKKTGIIYNIYNFSVESGINSFYKTHLYYNSTNSKLFIVSGNTINTFHITNLWKLYNAQYD